MERHRHSKASSKKEAEPKKLTCKHLVISITTTTDLSEEIESMRLWHCGAPCRHHLHLSRMAGPQSPVACHPALVMVWQHAEAPAENTGALMACRHENI